MGRSQTLGKTAEWHVAQILRFYGRAVSLKTYNHPYDLLVDEQFRIEVKCADMQMQDDAPLWKFNIHRHGVVNERADFYVFRLEHVPFTKYAVHLLFKAPLETSVAQVSFRSLLNKDAIAVVDFYRFARGEFSPTKSLDILYQPSVAINTSFAN